MDPEEQEFERRREKPWPTWVIVSAALAALALVCVSLVLLLHQAGEKNPRDCEQVGSEIGKKLDQKLCE